MKRSKILMLVCLAGFLFSALVALADMPVTQAGLTILGHTDDYIGPMAQGDFNGDGVLDLAIGATGT